MVVNPGLAQEVAAPRHALADDPVPADTAWQLVYDELMLEGNARLNLATFVTTWLEPQVTRLIARAAGPTRPDAPGSRCQRVPSLNRPAP